MKKIAIIIPTIKQYEISCKLAVDSIINSINRNRILDYEIFISGPEKPNDSRVTFIKEEKQTGENITINNVAKQVSSFYDYTFLTADDHIITDDSNLLDSCNFLQSETYTNRRIKICTLATSTDSPCYAGSCLPFPDGSPYGKVFRPNDFFEIPQFMICRFPVFTKDTFKYQMNERIFPENINSGYGDNCLGYFLYANNEPCIEYSNVKLSFMEHIHNVDRISRWKYEWIDNRSQSCMNAHNFMKNYKKGNLYV